MASFNLKANSGSGGGFVKPPAGNHPAVCVAVIDLGTHTREFNGQAKDQRQIYFCWELPTETVAGTTGTHHVIATRLTASLNEKAKLRQWIEGRRAAAIPDGQDYNVFDEVGKPCLLNVKANGEYVNVEGMSALPKGFTVPPTQNKGFYFSLNDYEGGPISLPAWLPYLFGQPVLDVIEASAEVQAFPAEMRPSNAAARQGGTSPPPASPLPASPPAVSSAPAAAQPVKYWIAYNPDAGDPELTTADGIKSLFDSEMGKQIDWKVVEVCRDGTSEWLPLSTGIPESKSWIPF